MSGGGVDSRAVIRVEEERFEEGGRSGLRFRMAVGSGRADGGRNATAFGSIVGGSYCCDGWVDDRTGDR